MTLYEEMKIDLTKAMKSKAVILRSTLRVIMGEFPRLNKKAGETPTDKEIIGILKKLKKNEGMVLKIMSQRDSGYMNVINSYLPVTSELSADAIREWIKDNIDLSKYKNSMQAMGPIMKELKGKADGALVRKILGEL